MARAAAGVGIDYPALCGLLVRYALRRRRSQGQGQGQGSADANASSAAAR